MKPSPNHRGSEAIHGLSIRLDDGTVVSLEAVIAEGRRQRAREVRRLTRAALRRIGRAVRVFVSLVPGTESRRKIPTAIAGARVGSRPAFVSRTEDVLARVGRAFFQTDAALGHIAGASVEDVAEVEREDKRRDDERRLAA